MAALKNAKHELFAQALAKGMSQTEAYADAGYTGDRTAASRLSTNVNIVARLAEILDKAATRTEITVASITERLLAIAKKAETSDEAPMLQAARASLMDAAKLNGLVIDKADTSNASALTVTYVNAPPGPSPEPSPEDYET